MSVIKALLTTIPVFYSMSGENNADLLVITGINTFLIKKVVTKLSKEGYSNSFQHPHPTPPTPKKKLYQKLSKRGTEHVQAWESCCMSDFEPGLFQVCSCFDFQG